MIRLPGIERLRAVAVLFVMVSHAKMIKPLLPAVLGETWTGVDLFFVISGFVVTASFLHSVSRGDRPPFWRLLRAFYVRRMCRVLPMALLWMIVPLLLALLIDDPAKLGNPRGILTEIGAILALVYNYMAVHLDSRILGVYWSLNIEEQFYLLLPTFLLLVTGRRARIIGLLLVALVIIFILRPLIGPPRVREVWIWEFYATHRRIDMILWGVLLFMGVSWFHAHPTTKLPGWVAAVIQTYCIAALALLPWYLIEHEVLYTYGLPVLALHATVLVLLATDPKRDLVLAIPGVGKVLEYLGSRSFGLYLIHSHVYKFVVGPPIVAFALGVAVTVVLAELCYRGIEAPLIGYGKARSRTILGHPTTARVAA
jgi:peptidoglycan/LPS O-acetylase OafA/YrhL